MPRLKKARLASIALTLLALLFIMTATEEDSYGYERPVEDWDDFDDQPNVIDLDNDHVRTLSPSSIQEKLHVLTEQLENLRRVPAPHVVSTISGSHSFIKRLFFPWQIKQEQICDSFNAEGRLNRTVLISPWQTFNNYDSDDVTMVTHTTVSRMKALDLSLSFWPGPLSIAVSLHSSQIQTFQTLLSSTYRHWLMRDNLDFHFVRNEGKYYPFNFVRKIALENVKTRYVFLNDVDFIPQSNLYAEFRKLRHTADMSKTAYIIPAFEFLKTPESFPETKKDLLKAWEKGTVQPSRYQPNLRFGHSTTDYRRWISSKQPYEVAWKMFYEPYVFADTAGLPEYDIRFIGRSRDKISYIDKVAASGYRFVVLPNVFIIHYKHPISRDDSYFKCADDLYHLNHLPIIKSMYEERGVSPPIILLFRMYLAKLSHFFWLS